MLEDIGIMSGLPNFRVIAPADALETKRVIKKNCIFRWPIYVRLSREKVPTLLSDMILKLVKVL
jgi:transketolase subunit B (EC 2.2.1.1)